ncbi:MAG: hypothetical protein PHV57_04170 [Methanomicrobiaceae archaeon]|nr:hypothetical protein [Methanomicrobiaceae archaeon]
MQPYQTTSSPSLPDIAFVLHFPAAGYYLIGGWAVDAYNPYVGSVDIDLVTTARYEPLAHR